MTMPYFPGVPGYQTVRTSQPRIVFRDGQWMTQDYPGGAYIAGALSRDQGNTGDVDTLRAGVLMGKVQDGGTYNNLYAPSILGLTGGAYTVSGTSLTVTAAAATEIARRITTVGAGTTFKIAGPPAASGVVTVETVTFSAISGTTMTITALLNSYVSGAILLADDGSEYPLTVIPDGSGVKVTDVDGTSTTVEFPHLPIGGTLMEASIVNWPTDTSSRAFLRSLMQQPGGSRFTFDGVF